MNKKEKEKDLQERLNKALYKFRKSELQQFSNYLSSPFRIIMMNFLAGTMRGLGFLVGATIVLTIIVYIITQVLAQIPIVGEMFQWLGDFIQQNIGIGGGGALPPSVGG